MTTLALPARLARALLHAFSHDPAFEQAWDGVGEWEHDDLQETLTEHVEDLMDHSRDVAHDATQALVACLTPYPVLQTAWAQLEAAQQANGLARLYQVAQRAVDDNQAQPPGAP